MSYETSNLSIRTLLGPVATATAALTRLDERVARSSVKDGWIARCHFADTAASMWVDGDLVLIEDLVLHDAGADIRTPTHELTLARGVLRARRAFASKPPQWALTSQGLGLLRGGALSAQSVDVSIETVSNELAPDVSRSAQEDTHDSFEKELADMDAVLARSGAALTGLLTTAVPRARERDPLVYESDWDEEQRFEEWQATLAKTAQMPPLLRAAVSLDAWHVLTVVQHDQWLGRLLAASILRESGVATAHLPGVSLGLKSIARDRRSSADQDGRILAILEAISAAADIGLREHDRLLLAKQQLQHRLIGRRQSSKLPQLIELVLARPMVSSAMIAEELGVTPQGALKIAAELNLRELTGRGRFRAWGII